MKIALLATPASQRQELATAQLRFGAQTLALVEDEAWPALRDQLDQQGVAVARLDSVAKRKRPFLVQQKGRLFQRHHPKVEVLHDRGRFLLVAMGESTAREIIRHPDPCFRIIPVEEDMVVFDERPVATTHRTALSWVQQIVDTLDSGAYYSDLAHLASYPTRHSYTSSFNQAATWARAELNNLGYQTSLQNFSYGGQNIVNVIADKVGGQNGSRQLLLVTAHLDSININGTSTSLAPGADDNASGSAAVLAIGRALSHHNGRHDLRLVLFGGEEQGLRGSQHFVSQLSQADRNRLMGVINMDMIASRNSATNTVLLEGATVSQTLIDQLTEAAASYTNLQVQTSLNPYASDHVPFINAGLPAVLTIEGADDANANIHSADDTPDTLELDLAMEILRMNTALISHTLGQQGDVTMPTLTPKDYQLNPELLELLDKLKFFRFQYSGKYTLNGGASARQSRIRMDARASSIKALNNPIYSLNKPVYLDELAVKPSFGISSWWEKLNRLRCTLHIDIDGTDPLNVVSGTVSRGLYAINVSPPHFIGQVTSNTYSNGARQLVVENFSFQWPRSATTIDRLEIELTGNFFQTPVAEVRFVNSASGQSYGPYTIKRESTYFHEVEFEVDREDGAVSVEPYNTHTHPDRPADLTEENLTIESAFQKAGIRVTRSSESNTVSTADAGANSRWNYQELHDAMEDHWSAFANRPQWKMWLFLAELADSDGLGGVMFDGDIDEPGGVDRQGTAIFTKCPYFHTTGGGYIQANPPVDEAVARELFFNTIHESGHAFNLAHSWQKTQENEWAAPSWMPLGDDDNALSWMNYPDRPSPGANATWFYERFRFRFNDSENLFLRHAPDSYVQMGNEDWFENHARVTRGSLDPRLSLAVRTQKQVFEYGEPINLELKLKNCGNEPVLVHRQLEPSDGMVDIAITAPDGQRTPLIPLARNRSYLDKLYLEPNQALYQAVNASVGKLGFGFKQPGAYRIEVAFRNIDGRTAAAVTQIYVQAASNTTDTAIINEMFDARVARVLYVGGSRIMEDVNDKLDWMAQRLGERHPLQHTLAALRALPLASNFKTLAANADRVKLLDEDPDFVERALKPAVTDITGLADTLGHIQTRALVDIYTDCAMKLNKRSESREAQGRLLEMFKARKVIPNVIEEIELRHKMLKGIKLKQPSSKEPA